MPEGLRETSLKRADESRRARCAHHVNLVANRMPAEGRQVRSARSASYDRSDRLKRVANTSVNDRCVSVTCNG